MEDCRGEEKQKQQQREKCRGGCERPASVCLCNVLPSETLETSTRVIILQHPHELRHKLSTVPLLQKCLRNSQVIVGRRLNMGSSPILDAICSQCDAEKSKCCHVLLLFPGEEATDLETWISNRAQSGMPDHPPQNENENGGILLLLIVIDGTWQHAKEMVKASLAFLSRVNALQVCLPHDRNTQGHSIWNSDLILRKEPFGGCVSTMEAVARSLRILEPTPFAFEIEHRLLSVLRAMVAFQFHNLKKPMKPRPRLHKKSHCPTPTSS